MENINDIVGHSLKIYQNDDWFKFSLESVLLPNFVTINLRTKNILDLCTGNAPIPLILSTKTKAKIYGIEIQRDIYELGKKSISINNLDNQIEIINDDLINLNKYFSSEYFDLITVNPPYFKNIETSSKNNDEHKTIARHETNANIETIIKIGRKFLKNDGRLCLVHRTDRFLEILELLKQNNLMPKKLQFIYPKQNMESNLFMVEATKNGKEGIKLCPPLFIHNEDGTYKDDILKIFNY